MGDGKVDRDPGKVGQMYTGFREQQPSGRDHVPARYPEPMHEHDVLACAAVT